MRRTLKCDVVPRWVVLWSVRTTDPEAPEKMAWIHFRTAHGLAQAALRALSKRGAASAEMTWVEMSDEGKTPGMVQPGQEVGIAGVG